MTDLDQYLVQWAATKPPRQLADETGQPLAHVRYRLRRLKEAGAIPRTRHRTRPPVEGPERLCLGPCGRTLPLSSFGPAGAPGKQRPDSRCRECRALDQRSRYAATPERRARTLARSQRWRAKKRLQTAK